MDADSLRGFREFMDRRSPDLLRTAVLLTGGDRYAAEDLLQGALVKAAGRWQRIDNPEAYVRRILYREQIGHWRLTWPRRELSVAEPPDHVDEAAEEGDPAYLAELRLMVREALHLLTARQRTMLVLRYYEDLPEADVARILGCSVGTVRSTTHRSLARLRRLVPELARLGGGDGGLPPSSPDFAPVEVRP